MSILSDIEIKQLCIRPAGLDNQRVWKPMIEPFLSHQVKEEMVQGENGVLVPRRIVSKGLSSFGYDVTLGREFKIFTDINSTVIDPLNFKDESYVDFVGDVCIIPPNSFALAVTEEQFCIPRDMIVLVANKSTYARCGIQVAITVIEPEQGRDIPSKIVLEIANSTPLPAKVYAGQGIAQFLFLQGKMPCEISYADRGGKYVSQQGIVLPKV